LTVEILGPGLPVSLASTVTPLYLVAGCNRPISKGVAVADIGAFPAIRYNLESIGRDLTNVVAPPYDVLDQADKDRLSARDSRNIVAIDLPHVPPKSRGPDECYIAARETMNRWLEDGTLVQDGTPAIYAYHQAFTYGNQPFTRKMFFARLRLEPFETGTVLAHEETFGGPKEDRLALMKTTFANLSPVFGLYPDPDHSIAALLDDQTHASPAATARVGDVDNSMWIIQASDSINRLVAAFMPLKVYIADGHHRYNTALTFRDWVASERGGSLDPNHPANFVLIAFASMDDPGSLILPTHRVLAAVDDMPIDSLFDAWSAGCERVGSHEDADMTLHQGADGREIHVRFTNRTVLDELEPDKSDAWKGLDVAYLHRYLIDELFTANLNRSSPPKVRYIKETDEAKSVARNENGIALICKGATMKQLRDVSDAFDRMPQKSTYFYPKVATGMTMNPLR
jgi:uncharacterized protein (DUF1015 family)